MEKEVTIMMVFRVTLKGILKEYFTLIISLMKSQSNFGKLAIKHKIMLRLFMFFTSGTQIFGALLILSIGGVKGREK